MDPEVAKYFKKILNSFSMGLLWMLAASTTGFYFGLALFDEAVHWYNLVFYTLLLASFGALLWYYYRLWR
jgi:hypothetical protein